MSRNLRATEKRQVRAGATKHYPSLQTLMRPFSSSSSFFLVCVRASANFNTSASHALGVHKVRPDDTCGRWPNRTPANCAPSAMISSCCFLTIVSSAAFFSLARSCSFHTAAPTTLSNCTARTLSEFHVLRKLASEHNVMTSMPFEFERATLERSAPCMHLSYMRRNSCTDSLAFV